MNMQECYNLLNEFIDKHKELETAKDIGEVLNLLNAKIKDNRWVNAAGNLLQALSSKYPPINYFTSSYKSKVKLPYNDIAKLCHNLIIAGLCIDTELFIDSRNYGNI